MEILAIATMRIITLVLLVILFSCSSPKEKHQPSAVQKEDTAVTIQSSDVNTAQQEQPAVEEMVPIVPRVKRPAGIYQVSLSMGSKMEQTIAFNSDLTYRLEEKYPDKKDSIVITEGNWMPSDGFIWLYKDQVERGRYQWRGDTLQYFSAAMKKDFPMQQLSDAAQSEPLRYKGKNGIVVYGVSNEPFWSVECSKDSVSFLLSDWAQPLKVKLSSSFQTADSVGYIGHNDSAEIRLVVFPYFCTDGMSNLTYRNKIKVHYNQQVYTGCGVVYQ